MWCKASHHPVTLLDFWTCGVGTGESWLPTVSQGRERRVAGKSSSQQVPSGETGGYPFPKCLLSLRGGGELAPPYPGLSPKGVYISPLGPHTVS